MCQSPGDLAETGSFFRAGRPAATHQTADSGGTVLWRTRIQLSRLKSYKHTQGITDLIVVVQDAIIIDVNVRKNHSINFCVMIYDIL